MITAKRSHLWALKDSGGSDSITFDLGAKKNFLVWGSVTMVDPLADFDKDNAYAFDVYTVDGSRTQSKVSGGDHWGPSGSFNNVYEGAKVGYGRYVTCWLRAMHSSDLDVLGVAVIIVLD